MLHVTIITLTLTLFGYISLLFLLVDNTHTHRGGGGDDGLVIYFVLLVLFS